MVPSAGAEPWRADSRVDVKGVMERSLPVGLPAYDTEKRKSGRRGRWFQGTAALAEGQRKGASGWSVPLQEGPWPSSADSSVSHVRFFNCLCLGGYKDRPRGRGRITG